ncbi:hypothetical protein K8942_05725 [Candidatus Peribacteria bacterium]|nr:MAG: hypothetical protein K8942_05725 [Candidatus Peribacteria bacterium]
MRRALQLVLLAAFFLSITPVDAATTPLVNSALRPMSLRINVQSDTPVLNDFTLGPTRFILSMAPGEERTVDVELTNRSGTDAIFNLTSEDFIANPEQEGTPMFFAEGLDSAYSARRWLTPEIRRVQLLHADRAFIRVTVRVPANADAGDHQAALIVTREIPPTEESGINIVSRVASLFVVSVQGDVIENGLIDSLTASKRLNWSLPVHLRLLAKNTGTVHMLPTGTVDIRNIFGIPVDEVPFKDWVVLRESERARTFTWSPRFALGRYTASTDFTAFNGRHLESVSTSFWVIPLLPVLVILLLIFLVSFLVQYVMARFEFRRREPENAARKTPRKKESR